MKRKNQLKSYEILTVPFVGAGEVEGDDLSDLGELQEGEIRGKASVFGRVVDAFTPTIMQRGAFTKTLQERARSIPVLWQHDMSEPIGRPTHLIESDEGLMLQAQISRTDTGRKALTLIRDGVVRSLSIGFEPVQFDFEEQSDGSMIRFIREARLIEVSVVTLGADPNALITEVRSGDVAGSLETYVIGHGVLETEEPTEEPAATIDEGTESLAVKLDRFSAEHLAANPMASDTEVLEAFAQTLSKPEPVVEPLHLTDVEHQLQLAELRAAELYSLD